MESDIICAGGMVQVVDDVLVVRGERSVVILVENADTEVIIMIGKQRHLDTFKPKNIRDCLSSFGCFSCQYFKSGINTVFCPKYKKFREQEFEREIT